MKDSKTIILRKSVSAIPTPLEKGDEVQLQRICQNKQGNVILVFKLVGTDESSKILLNKEYAVELSELA